MKDRVNINGFQIYPFRDKKEFIEYLAAGNWNSILVAMNAEKVMQQNRELQEIVNRNIGYPDGIGVVMALYRRGEISRKIAGSEFWLDIIEEFCREKTFYFVGNNAVAVQNTVQKLKRYYPGIEIAGYSSYNGESEISDKLMLDIKQSKPDIVFIAMDSPRQELLMQQMKSRQKALYMGLGESFYVYGGLKGKVPDVWIHMDLEWLYRLFTRPGNILKKRVLVKFFYRLLLNKF